MKIGKRSSLFILTLALLGGSLAACSNDTKQAASNDWGTTVKLAKKEGQVKSVGMPDTWTNWIGTWHDIKSKYNVKHVDTDMSSAQELQNFKKAKGKSASDIGDIGINVAPTAIQQNLLAAYKSPYWNKIPNWAKDKKGYWSAGYTGTIVFITDTKNVKAADAPTSWQQLATGKYQVSVGDVTTGAQSQYAVLAAAYANGGNEKDIQPGINYFAKIKKAQRLSTVDASVENLKKGETQVSVMWDFNALNYRHLINEDGRYKITVPTDGSVMSGYTEVINKNASHPNAARLARGYILSKQGQINLAKGYARPIRTDIQLPESVKKNLLPESDYQKVYHVKDNDVWNKTTIKLAQLWQSDVQSAK